MHDHGEATRRDFLRGSVAVLAAAGPVAMITGCAESSGATGPATRMAARRSSGRPPVWAITCRDAHLRETGCPDSWSALKAIGADGAEVTVDRDLACNHLYAPDEKFSLASTEAIDALGRRFRDHQLKVWAFCLGNRFDTHRDEEIACTVKTAEAAAKLGVPAVRVDIVPRSWKGTQDEFCKYAAEAMREIVQQTSHTNVRFGVENHGHATNDVNFLRGLIDGVGSERFGVTLDTANFYWFGYPLERLYEIYAEFAPHTCHTHCKSINYPVEDRQRQRPTGYEYGKYNCPVYAGDIDFKRVGGILRAASYTGDLCIENESLGKFPEQQRVEVLKKEIDHLRSIAQSM